MALSPKTVDSLLERGYSRRMIGRISMGMAAAVPLFNEFAQAQQSAQQMPGRRRSAGSGDGERPYDPDTVVISSNENPMGPTREGIEALTAVGPLGWRYHPRGANLEFDALLHSSENVKPGYVNGYPGSSQPLAQCVPAFTSPARPWVMGSPGYGSGGPRWVGSKVIKVPLRKDFAHDVEAMIKADPNAGAYYICNPNNPSGTLTSMKDFQYILDNKPKDAVLIVDEAYVHFADPWKTTAMDLVRQDKDVVILRTFSKIYGMAGLRAGAIYGRPDLLAKVAEYGRANFMPVTATACAAASLKAVRSVIPERIAINRKNRQYAYEAIDKLGVSYIPSESNFFMMSVKGMTGAQVYQAMAAKKVMLAGAGRWPEWPQHIRVTVGTWDEMTKFNAALAEVVKEGPATSAKAG